MMQVPAPKNSKKMDFSVRIQLLHSAQVSTLSDSSDRAASGRRTSTEPGFHYLDIIALSLSYHHVLHALYLPQSFHHYMCHL